MRLKEIQHIVEETNSEVIVGVGGGKVLDTTKACGYYAKKPIVVIPTAASTDAPCSSLSVIYHDDHTFDHYLYLPKSPESSDCGYTGHCECPSKITESGYW